MNNVLEVRDLHKTYRTQAQAIRVLQGVNLSIPPGEVLSVVGSSGTGKTTLLNVLGGLSHPDRGYVVVGGWEMYKMPDNKRAEFRNRRVGFVFQFHHLLPEFTALENTALPARIARRTLSQADFLAQEMLENVGLGHRLHHRPSELSGGEQQRVAIARALVNEPDIVLADEPTGNLDRNTAQAVFELMLDLNRHLNQTILFATHNLAMAKQTERVLTLTDRGTLEEVSKTKLRVF